VLKTVLGGMTYTWFGSTLRSFVASWSGSEWEMIRARRPCRTPPPMSSRRTVAARTPAGAVWILRR